MEIQMAVVTEIVADKVKVKFNQDDSPSALEYTKLSSYKPLVDDKVLMLETNTSFICLGGVGNEPSEVAENPYLVGEYKFFAKGKGSLWRGWARCDGRELSATTYPELFEEIGVTFGGSGGSFNLPDTGGRVLSDASDEVFGGKVGAKTITLTTNQMPSHSHVLKLSDREYASGNGRYALEGDPRYSSNNSESIQSTGGGSSHENRQPTLYGGYYYIYTGVI